MTKTLLILGAGGHGKAVAEATLLCGQWQHVLFVDGRWPQLQESFGLPVLANMANLTKVAKQAQAAIAAVGDNIVREAWVAAIAKANLPLATVVHPSACVSLSAKIGAGSAIMALAMVGVDAKVGQAVIINANATLDHDASLGDFAHLGVGVQISGGVHVGARAWLQVGCCAGYRVVVADGVQIGPGTVLVDEG